MLTVKWVLLLVTLFGTEPNAQTVGVYDDPNECIMDMRKLSSDMKKSDPENVSSVMCLPTRIQDV